MARTYRNTPEIKQTNKRRKSKKNKAMWKAFREQQHRQSGGSFLTQTTPIKPQEN